MKLKVGDEFVFKDKLKHTIPKFSGRRCKVTGVRGDKFQFTCDIRPSKDIPEWNGYVSQLEDIVPAYIADSPLYKTLS